MLDPSQQRFENELESLLVSACDQWYDGDPASAEVSPSQSARARPRPAIFLIGGLKRSAQLNADWLRRPVMRRSEAIAPWAPASRPGNGNYRARHNDGLLPVGDAQCRTSDDAQKRNVGDAVSRSDRRFLSLAAALVLQKLQGEARFSNT